jgi:hypothetical protein
MNFGHTNTRTHASTMDKFPLAINTDNLCKSHNQTTRVRFWFGLVWFGFGFMSQPIKEM